MKDVFSFWKEHLNSDHVFKDQTHYLFCHTIEDAVYEDVLEEPINHLSEPVEPAEPAEPAEASELSKTEIEEPTETTNSEDINA